MRTHCYCNYNKISHETPTYYEIPCVQRQLEKYRKAWISCAGIINLNEINDCYFVHGNAVLPK